MEGATKSQLIDFLLAVCTPVLACSRDELLKALTKGKDADKIRSFISDAQVSCMLIGREAIG